MKLLSEGNQRLPKAADVSPEVALPPPPWSYCGKLSPCPGVRGSSGRFLTPPGTLSAKAPSQHRALDRDGLPRLAQERYFPARKVPGFPSGSRARGPVELCSGESVSPLTAASGPSGRGFVVFVTLGGFGGSSPVPALRCLAGDQGSSLRCPWAGDSGSCSPSCLFIV